MPAAIALPTIQCRGAPHRGSTSRSPTKSAGASPDSKQRRRLSRSRRAERLPAFERGEQLVVDLPVTHLRRLGANRVLRVELGAGEQRGELLLLDLERFDALRQRIELALFLVAELARL